MNNFIPSQAFEKEIIEALSVPDASTEFVNALRSKLILQTQKKETTLSSHRFSFRRKFAWAASLLLVLVFLITFFLVGPQEVLAAVRGLFGYIPGIGIVDSSVEIRVLKEPVTIERDGIIMSVLQAAMDDQHMVIVYQVDNLSLAAANSQGENVMTGSLELLRFPDGNTYQPLAGSGEGWGIGYQTRLEYPPLPIGADEAVFIVPIIQGMPSGAAPENWELTIQFIPAPDDLDMMPVYELSVPDIEITPPEPLEEKTETSENLEPDTDPSNLHDIEMVLERVAELDNGYILQGYVSWEGSEVIQYAWSGNIQLFDANGSIIPSEFVQSEALTHSEINSRYTWAIQTESKQYKGPWTISIPSLILDLRPDHTFQIDLGDNPELVQSWEFDQIMEISGYRVTLSNMRFYQDESEIWLEFAFNGDPWINSISVMDINNLSEAISGKGSGGGSGQNEQGDLISAFSYDYPPSGIRDIAITTFSVQVEGPWQINWQPPNETIQNEPVPANSDGPCLTAATWLQIQQQPPANIPPGLKGQLLLMRPVGTPLQMVSLTTLDGVNRDIENGSWPDLSPDKNQLVFSKGDGLYISDLQTREVSHINVTKMSDEYPIWSPDGNWIAFLRIPEETIYRMHPDGSQLQPLIQNNEIVNLSRWMPDNQILIEAFAKPGASIRSFDIETGEMFDIFQTENHKPSSNYAISSIGSKIAYANPVFGHMANGIYISELNQTDSELLIDLDQTIVLVGDWNAAGDWLAVTIYGPDPELLPLLIHPQSCQIVPLWNLKGQVISWIE
ncbi:MAG: PD40 domain-containing protein [Anaerolineaceae bacterium]|nr:PD40 domain-containing protein [Anaerolineaceae bacterium]